MNYISTSMLFVISECLVCLVSDVSRFVDERIVNVATYLYSACCFK